VVNGQVIDLYTLALGSHTLTVHAVDKASNASSASVTFNVIATIDSLKAAVMRFYDEGKIWPEFLAKNLLNKLDAAQLNEDRGATYVAIRNLQAFITEVTRQSTPPQVHIDPAAGALLITDAQWVINRLGATIGMNGPELLNAPEKVYMPYVGR